MNVKRQISANSLGVLALGLAVLLAAAGCTAEPRDAASKAAAKDTAKGAAKVAEVAKPQRSSWPMFRGSPGLLRGFQRTIAGRAGAGVEFQDRGAGEVVAGDCGGARVCGVG